MIEVDEDTATRLAQVANDRQVAVSELAAEALRLFIVVEHQPDHMMAWPAEDLAAIQEGVDQLDRGEFYTQDEVEAHVDALLRE